MGVHGSKQARPMLIGESGGAWDRTIATNIGGWAVPEALQGLGGSCGERVAEALGQFGEGLPNSCPPGARH
jgi:hypothetical protein